MHPLRSLLKRLDGLHYPQDYLCLSREQFPHTLQVYATGGGRVLADVTRSHLFVGYSPLIIALQPMTTVSELIFTRHALQPNEYFNEKDALARLSLSPLRDYEGLMGFYVVGRGTHRFQSGWQQLLQDLYNRRYNRKPGNVFLPGNLFRQVQIAYAVPRKISLITVGGGGLYNLFPTDLHGDAGNGRYVVSLREGGKACAQATTCERILLSAVNPDCYRDVYALGKNHMQELRPARELPFGDVHSTSFRFPVPRFATGWRELELESSFLHGIHRLLFFRITHQERITSSDSNLYHLHNAYASWLHNKGLSGNYLLR